MSRLSSKLFFLLLVFVIILIVVPGIFFSQGKVLSERHQPFENTNTFDFQQGIAKESRFQDYIAYSQDYLRRSRLDSPTEEFIQNASPFELIPNSTCERSANGHYLNGIVLTHGLIASPYSMRDIAEYFQSRCFYVLAILLPEHASRPGEFLHTQWQDWAKVQRFAFNILQHKVENVFLSGHSMGGELALYEAAINPKVKGLILFTPGMQITPAAKYASYFIWLGKLFPKAAWFEVRNDLSLYRYESITFSAAHESYKLIRATNKALKSKALSIPVFTVASVEDNTVDTDVILTFMEKQLHPASRTLLFSQFPIPAADRVKVVLSSDEKRGILSVSHLGIMLPDSHPEYGRDGAYKSCGHYFNEPEKFARCNSGLSDFYGEVSATNLQKGLIERIAFNPYYEALIETLDEFLSAATTPTL